MPLSVTLQDGIGGPIIKDCTPFIEALDFSTNEHGFDSCSFFVRSNLQEAFRIYDRPGLPHLSVKGGGMTAWEGRLEDPSVMGVGFSVHAFGYQQGYRDRQQAYSPAAYTAATSQTIIDDLIAAVAADNSFMSASTLLIENPANSITEIYRLITPSDLLDRLAAMGDGTERWEWGVWENQILHFRARGSQGRAWYTDVIGLSVSRSLDNVFNSVYGSYADTLTAEAADTFSQARYGVKRTAVVRTQGDGATVAANVRDVFLEFHKDPPARGQIDVPVLYDAYGTQYPLWLCRSGDSLTLRNLSPILSVNVDAIRTFRISTTQYHTQRGQRDSLMVAPELDIPVAV